MMIQQRRGTQGLSSVYRLECHQYQQIGLQVQQIALHAKEQQQMLEKLLEYRQEYFSGSVGDQVVIQNIQMLEHRKAFIQQLAGMIATQEQSVEQSHAKLHQVLLTWNKKKKRLEVIENMIHQREKRRINLREARLEAEIEALYTRLQ